MKRFLPAIFWAILILTLSLMPAKNLPEIHFDLLAPDKLAHAFVYAVLCILLLYGFQNGHWKTGILTFLLSNGFGCTMEIFQYAFFPDRYFEFHDIIANAIGTILGILAFILYHYRLKNKIG